MAEAETERSLLDEVRAAAEGLEPTVEGDQGNPVETPTETAQEKADRVRDEQGRFAKAEEGKPRETLKLKESKQPAEEKPGSPVGVKPDSGKTPEAPAADVTAGAAPAAEVIAPPAEWKGAGKVQWNKLPKPIQAELRETFDGLAKTREQYAPIEQAIAPHRDGWVRIAGSVESAITQLAQFHQLYLDNPRALIDHIARTRGIDLAAPSGQSPAQGATPQPAADLDSIIEQRLQQKLAPIEQRFAQADTQQLQSTIDAFAADSRYPYFQDVKVHMGQLIQAGLAKDLPEAYQKAVRLNDAIWSAQEAQKTEEAKNKQAAEVAKANQARAASLRGSPLPNGHAGGGAGQSASVLDDVRAADAELSGA